MLALLAAFFLFTKVVDGNSVWSAVHARAPWLSGWLPRGEEGDAVIRLLFGVFWVVFVLRAFWNVVRVTPARAGR